MRIVLAPHFMGGKPSIRGSRLSVSLILECLASGMTVSDINEAFDNAFLPEALPEVLRLAADLAGSMEDYPFTLRPLSEEEGGGYLIEYPDIPGCMSDGETPEEAIKNGHDALKASILTLKEFGDPVPERQADIDEILSAKNEGRH